MNKSEKFVITINRELGSGGRTVGRKLAERLQVKYYDKVLTEILTQKYKLTINEIERIKAQKLSWWDEFNHFYKGFLANFTPSADPELKLTSTNVFETERRILEALARQESCVVAGRSTFLMFKEWPNHLNVFIQAPLLNRIDRLARKRGITTEEALHILEEVDESRESYLQKYTDKSRYDTRNYDLVINMAGMTEDEAVDVIMAYIR